MRKKKVLSVRGRCCTQMSSSKVPIVPLRFCVARFLACDDSERSQNLIGTCANVYVALLKR